MAGELPEVVIGRGRAGVHHDLDDLLEQLEHEYFGGRSGVAIEWGRWPRMGCREFRLGSYYADRALIRISPVLDQSWVPRYFVGQVVYHERLHHEIDRERGGLPYYGRASHNRGELHGPEFLAAEARYRHHERSIAWEERCIGRLIRAAAKGRAARRDNA